jgi:hypothetical protein
MQELFPCRFSVVRSSLLPATLVLTAVVLWTPLALAQEAGAPEAQAAQDLVTRYLTAVKGKKWADAKKLIHPKTVMSIAERKKRLGKEDHPMAPWALEKTDSYLTQFKVQKTVPGVQGTFVVETLEDNFQVQEKGVAEGEMASYLVGRSSGQWYVVDKKRQETFNPTSIKIGYKGYFDKAPVSGSSTKEEEE